MTTGLVFHERYLWHDTGHGWIVPNDGVVVQPYEHPENPETKRRMVNLWRASGLLDQLKPIAPRPATVEEVLRVHTADYHQRIADLSAAGGGDAGGLTPFGLGSYEIALLAAGGCIAAVDAVLDGVVDNVYALVRPPGHHAIAGAGNRAHVLGGQRMQGDAVADWRRRVTGPTERNGNVSLSAHPRQPRLAGLTDM